MPRTEGFEDLPKTRKKKDPIEVKVTDKKFVRYREGAARYSMGLHTFEQLAKDAKAIYRVKKIVLVNTEILDKYMETFKED